MLEIIAFTEMGHTLKLIIKDLLGETNFEMGLKNDLECIRGWRKVYSRIIAGLSF